VPPQGCRAGAVRCPSRLVARLSCGLRAPPRRLRRARCHASIYVERPYFSYSILLNAHALQYYWTNHGSMPTRLAHSLALLAPLPVSLLRTPDDCVSSSQRPLGIWRASQRGPRDTRHARASSTPKPSRGRLAAGARAAPWPRRGRPAPRQPARRPHPRRAARSRARERSSARGRVPRARLMSRTAPASRARPRSLLSGAHRAPFGGTASCRSA